MDLHLGDYVQSALKLHIIVIGKTKSGDCCYLSTAEVSLLRITYFLAPANQSRSGSTTSVSLFSADFQKWRDGGFSPPWPPGSLLSQHLASGAGLGEAEATTKGMPAWLAEIRSASCFLLCQNAIQNGRMNSLNINRVSEHFEMRGVRSRSLVIGQNVFV